MNLPLIVNEAEIISTINPKVNYRQPLDTFGLILIIPVLCIYYIMKFESYNSEKSQ